MSQKKDLEKTIPGLEKLEKNIKEMRKQYQNIVHQHYKSENPFITGRENSENEVKKDVGNMYDIIVYSIIAGNLELLKTWVIEPINKGKVSMLAGHKNLDVYIKKLDTLKKGSETEIENYYFELIQKALKRHVK